MKLFLTFSLMPLLTISTPAATLFSATFESPQFSDGQLNGQQQWTGQDFFEVDSKKGTVTVQDGGYPRICNTTPATDERGFFIGDKLEIITDFSCTVPSEMIDGGLIRIGLLTEKSDHNNPLKPVDGFGLLADPRTKEVLISPKFLLVEGDWQTKLVDLYQKKKNNLIALSYADLGITDSSSDPIRIHWSAIMAGIDIWSASLTVKNLKTGMSWTYEGTTQITYPTDGDAFLSIHRHNGEENLPVHIDSVTYKYTGMHATETMGLIQ